AALGDAPPGGTPTLTGGAVTGPPACRSARGARPRRRAAGRPAARGSGTARRCVGAPYRARGRQPPSDRDPRAAGPRELHLVLGAVVVVGRPPDPIAQPDALPTSTGRL